jgi:hypothetical protein
MLPYGTIHHTYIHAYWSWPMLMRAKAPRTARAFGRLRDTARGVGRRVKSGACTRSRILMSRRRAAA